MSRGGRHAHQPTGARAVGPVGAATRQGAQEADACMARDDWQYSAPELTTEARRLADRKYLLP